MYIYIHTHMQQQKACTFFEERNHDISKDKEGKALRRAELAA